MSFNEPPDGTDIALRLLGFLFGGIFGAALLGFLTRRRRKVTLPLCARHRNYRAAQAIELTFWLVGLFTIVLVSLALLTNTASVGLALLLAPLLLVTYAVGLIMRGIRWVRIHATKFHARGLTLVGVSAKFASAYRSLNGETKESFLRSLATR